MVMTAYGALTRRHHAVVETIFLALKQARLEVERMEFTPFRRLRGVTEDEARMRLDIVVRNFPLPVLTQWETSTPIITQMLDGVDRTRTTHVDLLIDPTLSHPGARLPDAAADRNIANPESLGNACALEY